MNFFVTIILVVAGIIIALVGYGSLTQATQGVGLVGLACFVGILARMAQAANHQSEIQEHREEDKKARRAGPPFTP